MQASPPRPVAAFDYRPAYRELRAEIDAAIARVIESGRLVLGPEVEGLERELASWTGVREAVGVGSGTDALALALRAVGVGPGDEVITVANAGVPPVAAIRAAGATPRFVDVRPDTLLLDPEGLMAALTPRTRGVLPVHLYGQAATMGPILDFAARHGLPVVEDGAQALGASWGGRPVGSLGHVGCFSFYPTKNLGAFGDGGMCVTDDPAIAERLRMLRMYGFRGDRHAHCEGVNSRLDELQAAILRVKLRHVDRDIETRRRLAAVYDEVLAGTPFPRAPTGPGATHTFHLYVVRAAHRRGVMEALERASIGFGVHYETPVHLMEGYRFLGVPAGALPVTERACREVLSLPLYPGLSAEDQGRVIDVLRAVS